jgi:hypothetical protein
LDLAKFAADNAVGQTTETEAVGRVSLDRHNFLNPNHFLAAARASLDKPLCPISLVAITSRI